jgi:hypothetical protein
VAADRELLQSYCRLLFHHGTADYDAAGGVCTHILELVSASADHEMAPMVSRQSHGAGTVRIHGIGPGDILTPTRIEYGAATEVKDQTCCEAACAIERPQARFVDWPIAVCLRRWRSKARERVGVTAVEATSDHRLGRAAGRLA